MPRVDRVDGAVRVDPRVPLVGHDLVVDVGGRLPPVPHRQHEVALDAGRPRRDRRQLAVGDALGPVREHPQAALAAEAVHPRVHRGAALPGLHPVVPRREGRVEVVELIDLAGDAGAELVAELAPLLHAVDPPRLARHRRRDAVAVGAGAGELAPVGHLDERVPVVRGVDLRRVARRGGEDRAQGDLVSETPADPVGVDQPVAADPEVVGRLRELGQQEAPLVVGDDDLDELRLQVVGLGDHPDARFRAVVAADHPGDRPVVRQLPGSGRLVRPGQRDRQRTGCRRDTERAVSHAHAPLLGMADGRLRPAPRIGAPAHHSSPRREAPLRAPASVRRRSCRRSDRGRPAGGDVRSPGRL